MKTLIIALMLVFLCSASTKKGVGCGNGCSGATINSLKAGWWYNWNAQPHISSGVQFIPMVYSINRMGELPPYSAHVLGFNEPNYPGPSQATPQEAFQVWPEVVKKGSTVVSPSQAGNPSYDNCWLDQFMKLGPTVNYIGLHQYGTTNPDSFKAVITNTYNKYKKPIWITEFACQDNADSTTKPFSQAAVNNFLDVIIPWLESTSMVSHYAWHSASGGTSALWTASGELTETGKKYASFG